MPFILLLAGGWLRRAAPWRRGTAIVLRTLILCLLIIAQARPTFWDPDEHLTVALVVDRSESMSGPIRAAADQWLQGALAEARPDDNVTMVRFGRQAVTDRPGTGELPIDGTATNLESAIRLAGDLLPPTGERRVVVVTDGWENLGDAERAALDSARTGLEIAYAGLPAAAERARGRRPLGRGARLHPRGRDVRGDRGGRQHRRHEGRHQALDRRARVGRRAGRGRRPAPAG